ncbi:hypothetical protein DPMN_041765 [Dreissena polymorpha]|uniref:Uncharacterized protein n=1 Tax=Dreissena polymorpha TaxID=45954 RepID=A0A9D4CYF1_DREPO|nr:hypothetical protein DPMN_041765 [Dreissena polymorpha]
MQTIIEIVIDSAGMSGETLVEHWGEHIQAAFEEFEFTVSYPLRLTEVYYIEAAFEYVGLCNKVFEHVEAMLRKEEDEEVDAAEGDDKRVIKTLLNHFSTPCTSIIKTELHNSN